jgi:hypothetical protein
VDWGQFTKDVHLFWQSKPGVVVLLALGALIFLFLVFDVWHYKTRLKRRRPTKKWIVSFCHQTRHTPWKRIKELRKSWRP